MQHGYFDKTRGIVSERAHGVHSFRYSRLPSANMWDVVRFPPSNRICRLSLSLIGLSGPSSFILFVLSCIARNIAYAGRWLEKWTIISELSVKKASVFPFARARAPL